MSEECSLLDTIIPKSDQLNADDLMIAPITVTIEAVNRTGSKEQPIEIFITGHRPFRPCISMRRVLIAIWGDKGSEWIGKSMTLYRDPTAKWQGVEVGGVRISHVSGIEEERTIVLTMSRAKRSLYKVLPLKTMDYDSHIRAFKDKAKMRAWLVELAKENNWTNTTPVYVSLRNTCAERAKEIDAECSADDGIVAVKQ